MTPVLIITVIALYFLVLIGIAQLTSKGANNETFFTGNKQSPWYLVAFGMIGSSLSGVTFISVPGWVATSNFSYMQMVLGYLVGYFFIATVLMPMYYRLNLTSIYTYLEQRFGFWSYKTGAFFFLLSRTIGSAFRLFLVADVLQLTVFSTWNIPFYVTVVITILLIWAYTFKGGIKTIIWTDSLQTLFMLVAVGVSIWLISSDLNLGLGSLVTTIADSDYSQIFFFDDFADKRHFIKQFSAGAFIAIVMTGLDQDMMQKNLTCKNIGDAQKNMFWFSTVLVFVNFLFLCLGVLLYTYANVKGIEIPAKADMLYPMLANEYLGVVVGLLFILGLIAAAYSSADSALAALTTSFCVDFLELNKKTEDTKKTRMLVHMCISIMLGLVIMVFHGLNDDSIISKIFTFAGFTYGPLLGLYAFGLFTKLQVKDKFVPIVCVLSPVIWVVLNQNSVAWFNHEFGFEVLIYNGLTTFIGLLLLTKKTEQNLV